MGGCTGAIANLAVYEGIVNIKLYVMLISTIVVLFIIKMVEQSKEKKISYIDKVVQINIFSEK